MNYCYLVSTDSTTRELEEFDVGFIEQELPNVDITVKFLFKNLVLSLSPTSIMKFDISKTGDRFDHKVCDRCFKFLPTETHFENNRLKKDNVMTKRPSCRVCRKKKDGKSISKSDKKIWEQQKPELYSSFTCPVCTKTSIVGISKIVLDHNHDNGFVRGWICESCNTGLGRFDDDPEIVFNAVEYLMDRKKTDP